MKEWSEVLSPEVKRVLIPLRELSQSGAAEEFEKALVIFRRLTLKEQLEYILFQLFMSGRRR